MNYRHAFHAGNICDVVKHAVLTLLLEKLAEKEKPFAVLDTHAGQGLYNLLDERAQKTQEAEAGIVRFLKATVPESLETYARIVREAGAQNLYPGSPSIVRKCLRSGDRLMACELHPEDARALRLLFRDDPQVAVHERDGYEALGALCPPPEKRGLVLIDPPYEQPDEYDRLVEVLKKLHERWAGAMVMVWYPIKDRPTLWRFHEAMAASGIPKILRAEFIYQPEVTAERLNGSGLLLLNPPWKMDEVLPGLFAALHAALHAALQTAFQGDKIDWLAAEES